MNVTALKNQIYKAVEKTDDTSLLNEVYAILRKSGKKNTPVQPMTVEELLERDAQSEKEMKEGKLISHDEIKKRFGIKK